MCKYPLCCENISPPGRPFSLNQLAPITRCFDEIWMHGEMWNFNEKNTLLADCCHLPSEDVPVWTIRIFYIPHSVWVCNESTFLPMTGISECSMRQRPPPLPLLWPALF